MRKLPWSSASENNNLWFQLIHITSNLYQTSRHLYFIIRWVRKLPWSFASENNNLWFQLIHITCNSYMWNTLKTLWSLFMDGVQLPPQARATSRRQFTFYHFLLFTTLLPDLIPMQNVDKTYIYIYPINLPEKF